MCRRQLILSARPLKNKASLKADCCCTSTLPQFKSEGVVYKAACNRFPLEGHDPIITILDKLILRIYRGHPGIGPS